jgi:hypothetical protein
VALAEFHFQPIASCNILEGNLDDILKSLGEAVTLIPEDIPKASERL